MVTVKTRATMLQLSSAARRGDRKAINDVLDALIKGEHGASTDTNVSMGPHALEAVTAGAANTAIGDDALLVNTTGDDNTAVGAKALAANVTGLRNVAVGNEAGLTQAGTTDDDNVWIGDSAGKVATGSASGGNVAVGSNAMLASTTAIDTVAIGFNALAANITGNSNVAIGADAMLTAAGATDDNCVAVGTAALTLFNGGGSGENTAIGAGALSAVTTGDLNTAVGRNAGLVVTTGEDNVFLGNNISASGTGAAGEFAIGHDVTSIADSFVVGTTGDNINIDWKVGGSGSWSVVSDVRGKDVIGGSSLGLGFICQMNPIEYTRKPVSEWPDEWDRPKDSHVIDTETTILGLSAQEVKAGLDAMGAKAFGGWKVDIDGRQRVSPGAFVFPLINAVKELSAKVDALEAKLAKKK